MLAVDGAYCPYIHHCGDSPRQWPWSVPQRRLPHYLLVTSLKGAEQIVVGGQAIAIQSGQSYLIQPNTLHDIGSKRGNLPVWVHFDLIYHPSRADYQHPLPDQPELGDRAWLLQPDVQAIFDVDLPVVVPEELTPAFRQELPRLVQRWNEHDKLAMMAAALDLSKLLFAWVAQRWKELGLRKPIDLEARLRQAEDLALASLGTRFGVSEFAEAAGLSRAHFSEVFRKRRGVGPAAFLRDERLDRACHLLSTTDAQISEIGAAVGYPEPTVFGRAFRAHTGKSPRQFRERAQSKRA